MFTPTLPYPSHPPLYQYFVECYHRRTIKTLEKIYDCTKDGAIHFKPRPSAKPFIWIKVLFSCERKLIFMWFFTKSNSEMGYLITLGVSRQNAYLLLIVPFTTYFFQSSVDKNRFVISYPNNRRRRSTLNSLFSGWAKRHSEL